MLTQTIQTGSSRQAASRQSYRIPVPAFHAPTGPIEMMGAPMSFARNAEIYGEGEPADYLYKVVSGAVRTSKILADGRRQIAAFYVPGDVFGLETADEHTCSDDLFFDSKLLPIKRIFAIASA